MQADRYARRVFTWAAIYGFLSLTPMLFLERQVGQAFPPAITHPENYYGLIAVALAWQAAFLVIGRDPVRYRALMLPAIAEKLLPSVATLWLFAQQRVPAQALGPVAVDLGLAALFLLAWRRTA